MGTANQDWALAMSPYLPEWHDTRDHGCFDVFDLKAGARDFRLHRFEYRPQIVDASFHAVGFDSL